MKLITDNNYNIRNFRLEVICTLLYELKKKTTLNI